MAVPPVDYRDGLDMNCATGYLQPKSGADFKVKSSWRRFNKLDRSATVRIYRIKGSRPYDNVKRPDGSTLCHAFLNHHAQHGLPRLIAHDAASPVIDLKFANFDEIFQSLADGTTPDVAVVFFP